MTLKRKININSDRYGGQQGNRSTPKCGKQLISVWQKVHHFWVAMVRIYRRRRDLMYEKVTPPCRRRAGLFAKTYSTQPEKPSSGPLKKISEYLRGNFRHICQVLGLRRAWVIYYHDFPRSNPSPSTIFLTPLAIFRMKPGDRQ